MVNHYGASPGAWDHFDLVLGLGEDLLPVAADPNVGISPTSSLTSVGKVPSVYNSRGQIVGMAKWTEHITTSEEITRWSQNTELGMCIQTRRIRAIDVDISDTDEAESVYGMLWGQGVSFPLRTRSDSSKFLVLLDCAGELPKRRFKTEHGVIEFLGTGQQCVLDSTHPSGARYAWPLEWPTSIPILTIEELDVLWSSLEAQFAVEPSTTGSLSTKKQQLTEIISTDPVAQALSDQGLVISQAATGMLAIHCPFEDGHSPGSSATSTVYFPPHTGGYEFGHFDCKHASCGHRDDTDFKEAIGLRVSDLFDFVEDEALCTSLHSDGEVLPPQRFAFKHASEFVQGAQPRWIIKDVLPQAELAMIYGESGSGKSFFALDMILAVAQGLDWQGHTTVEAGAVAYLAAEGAGGAKNRIRAYMQHNHLNIADIPLFALGDSPSFLERKDVADVIAALRVVVGLRVVVVDTAACVVAGGDENSGKDMGRFIAHCRAVHKALGVLVVIIHHSGKDAARGARGWSGMRGALDVEICVTREGHERLATVTKMKDGNDEDLEFGFKLVPVTLEDSDGVTSCVIQYGELLPKAERKQPIKGTEQTLIDWLTDYEDNHLEWPSTAEVLAAIPRGGVLLEQLMEKNQVLDINGRITINK
jgi:hypothetical protein